MPVVFRIAVRMLKAHLVFIRVFVVDLPANIESLVVAAVRAKEAPSDELDVDFRNEYDAIVVTRTHEHVISFHYLLEPKKPPFLTDNRRLDSNGEHLHMSHINFIESLLFRFFDHFALRHDLCVDPGTARSQVGENLV